MSEKEFNLQFVVEVVVAVRSSRYDHYHRRENCKTTRKFYVYKV